MDSVGPSQPAGTRFVAQITPTAAFSSLWTLTYRGAPGTTLSVATYSGALLAFGYFFGEGGKLLEQVSKTQNQLINLRKLSSDAHGVDDIRRVTGWVAEHTTVVNYLGLLLLIAALVTVVALPLMDRVRSSQSSVPAE